MLQLRDSFLAVVVKQYNDQQAKQLTSMLDRQPMSSLDSAMHCDSCHDVLGAQQVQQCMQQCIQPPGM